MLIRIYQKKTKNVWKNNQHIIIIKCSSLKRMVLGRGDIFSSHSSVVFKEFAKANIIFVICINTNTFFKKMGQMTMDIYSFQSESCLCVPSEVHSSVLRGCKSTDEQGT